MTSPLCLSSPEEMERSSGTCERALVVRSLGWCVVMWAGRLGVCAGGERH